MLRKALSLLCLTLVLMQPANGADQVDQETRITRAVSFSGGGWSTHTASAGWLSGLLAAGQQGLVSTSTLRSIFETQDLVGGNSGGSWFLTMLAYSPTFASSLEGAPDVEEWFGPQGYMGSQIGRFEQLLPKAKTNLSLLLQSECPSYLSSEACRSLSEAVVDVIFQYEEGMWAPGLVFLASLWDGDFDQGPTWQEAVQIVYDFDTLSEQFRNEPFQGGSRAPFLGDQDIVVAGAMGTSIEVLNSAGRNNVSETNNLSVYPETSAQPSINGPIPIAFVDPGFRVDAASPLVTDFLPSGAKDLLYRSDITGEEIRRTLPAQVDLDAVSIFDVALISSAAAAGTSSESLVLEIARHLIEQVLSQTNLASELEGVDTQELGQTLFAGLSAFMKRAAIGATVDDMDRLIVGDLDPEADIWDLSDQRALRLYDGGYVDNLAAAYVLKQIQVAHNPDNFVLTLFANTGGIDDGEATADLLAQIGDELGEVLPLPSDVLNLFGQPNYLNPGTTAPLSMFGLELTTSSPAIFDARAWKNVAPLWVYQPNDDFRLSYYRLAVETIDNPHFQVQGHHQGTLHLFINQDAKISAAPFTSNIAEEYRNLFEFTRQAVLEQGYQYLAEALNSETDTPPRTLVPYEQQVQQWYVAYYGRPGDPAGVDYWADRLAQTDGVWIAELLNAFVESSEYTERFAGLTDASLINNLFLRLFNREADAAGLGFYLDLLNGSNVSGFNPELRQSTLVRIALDVANGAQSETDDQRILANKLAVAGYFTKAIRSSRHDYGASEIDRAAYILEGVGLGTESVTDAQSQIDEFVGL